MSSLSNLERAVLKAIADGAAEYNAALEHQLAGACVSARENTGAGFYTTFSVNPGSPLEGVRSPIGNIRAAVDGLEHGMGFLLWLKGGMIDKLEGYANANEDTSGLDFANVAFHDVEAG